ncbi:hypothetical protein E1287_07565 [Actinomadura sp. KC06]|uniref:hypothetical protein n=1 Tax=Actinomadura sp. KC06 TaxID=2530369 RepID=UPI00104D84C8|nr:hypothetical protein [Actinomadura sp. KC06]TDD37906.1 hypothetical protein E1287_07565 [Actinomadura sp. KC06]
MWTGPAWLKVVRDVVCMVIGAGGIIWQLASGKPDLAVLGFLAALMYVPSLFAAHWLSQPPTGGGSSVPQPPPPSPLPPSSSTPQE